MTEGLVRCSEKRQPCCFRDTFGYCTILNNTRFYDGQCHFRKIQRDGVNLYDRENGTNTEMDRIRRALRARVPVYQETAGICPMCGKRTLYFEIDCRYCPHCGQALMK